MSHILGLVCLTLCVNIGAHVQTKWLSCLKRYINTTLHNVQLLFRNQWMLMQENLRGFLKGNVLCKTCIRDVGFH